MQPHQPDRVAKAAARAASVAVALLTAGCGHVALGDVGASSVPGRQGTPRGAAAVATPGNAGGSTHPAGPVRTTAGGPADPWAAVSAPADAWAAWRPVLTGVREARPADVTSMRNRARAVLERDWTMELGPGAVLAHHHGETWLQVGQPGAAWDLEVHLPPVPVAQQGWAAIDRRPGTICSRKAGACLRLPIAQRPGAASLEIATQLAWMDAVDRVALQESGPDLLPPAQAGAPLAVARSDSPVGPLDCLLVARDEPHVMALEGRAARLWGTSPDTAGLCVDVRGMIVVAPPGSSSLPPFYTALRAGADRAVSTLPLPPRR